MGSFRLIFRRNVTDYIRPELCTVNDVASNAGAAYDAPPPPPRASSYRNIFQTTSTNNNRNGNGKENFRQGGNWRLFGVQLFSFNKILWIRLMKFD